MEPPHAKTRRGRPYALLQASWRLASPCNDGAAAPPPTCLLSLAPEPPRRVDRASGVNRPAERLSIGITVGAQGVRKRREVMLLEQSERMDDDPRTSSGRQHGSKQNQ